MEIETYLNAMVKAHKLFIANLKYFNSSDEVKNSKYFRQYRAFRARILRMDAEKDDVIEGQFKAIVRQLETIMQLRNEIEMIEASYSGLQYEMAKALKEKDKRIAELEKWVDDNAVLVHVHKRSNQ